MKDLSLHIMDIAQNSISAKASFIQIEILEQTESDILRVIMQDDGQGIPENMLEKVTDPYVTSRTTRKVGLGLPLLKQNAERTGGKFTIESAQGKGTRVEANFGLRHFDRPPLGDIAGTMVLLAAANPEIRFVYKHRTDANEYIFDTREVNEMLDGESIADATIVRFLKEMINENLQEIKVTA